MATKAAAASPALSLKDLIPVLTALAPVLPNFVKSVILMFQTGGGTTVADWQNLSNAVMATGFDSPTSGPTTSGSGGGGL